MKRTQVPSSKKMKVKNLMATDEPGQSIFRRKQGGEKDLLLRHPNFVAKSTDASFETPPLACEASALTTELTAQDRIYFSLQIPVCKHTELLRLFSNSSKNLYAGASQP